MKIRLSESLESIVTEIREKVTNLDTEWTIEKDEREREVFITELANLKFVVKVNEVCFGSYKDTEEGRVYSEKKIAGSNSQLYRELLDRHAIYEDLCFYKEIRDCLCEYEMALIIPF